MRETFITKYKLPPLNSTTTLALPSPKRSRYHPTNVANSGMLLLFKSIFFSFYFSSSEILASLKELRMPQVDLLFRASEIFRLKRNSFFYAC
ncbi:unnamed protein product [Tenebrio molitor]|nr:unnamed protein product [Tenebrio molitor]